MATGDVATRALAVVARIVAERAAGYNAAPERWDSSIAPVIELDATPTLIRLAEAVASDWRERAIYDDGGQRLGWYYYFDDDTAAEISAALADLAALGGEVGV